MVTSSEAECYRTLLPTQRLTGSPSRVASCRSPVKRTGSAWASLVSQLGHGDDLDGGRYGSELNHDTKTVKVRPALDDLSVAEAEDVLGCKLHLGPGRRDTPEI